jgi:hypothetical protein
MYGLFGSLVIATALGCAGEDPAPPVTVAPAPSSTSGLYVVMTRPPNVPATFVATPNGWFDPDCVVAVAPGERVTIEGHVARENGSIRREARQCKSPRYDVEGRVVAETNVHGGEAPAVPTTNGWVEYANSTALGAMSYVHAQWTVPAAPTSNTGQVIYFFPGTENASSGTSIMQPVLGYNHAYGPAGVWSMASWNCCVTGTTWYSTPFISAVAGTTVSGDMQGTGCNVATGVCPNWSIVSRNSAGTTTTLATTTTQAQNWLFGHVLEAYGIDTCSELPASSPSVASGFVLRNAAGTTVSPPAWTNSLLGVTPSCSYAISHTATTATLAWSNGGTMVCTPGDDRSCCPFPNGCSCNGDQICNAAGTGWGACMGAGQAGHPCP